MLDVVKPEILVVDDDPEVCETLVDLLEAAGFRVQAVPDGLAMAARLDQRAFSLVIIDLRLRNEDGIELARNLRTRSRIPIIILTGQGTAADRVLGLETAVDDFIAKPFDNRELVARIRALLRRSTETGMPRSLRTDRLSHERYLFGDWSLNITARELLHSDGSPCDLTHGEFALLEVFVLHANRVIDREQLLLKTRSAQSDVVSRTIDVLVSRLRRKIEDDPDHPRYICTERGAGYRFSANVVRC
ncbi:MAG: response regulator transcription factor [Variovorax sp.]|nr:response regulator transcription factor [Variovorax sp.]